MKLSIREMVLTSLFTSLTAIGAFWAFLLVRFPLLCKACLACYLDFF